MRLARLSIWMSAALALGACYSPNLDRCRVTCDDSNLCPGAQVCLDDGFCHQPGDELCNPDAELPPLIDAGPDAEPPDGEPMLPPQIRILTASGDFGCAITGDTRLYCWGYNGRGAMGMPIATRRALSPVQIGTDVGWSAVDAGDTHICGIRNDELYCWGADDSGEVGDANPNQLDTPTIYPGSNPGWTAVSAGRGFTCGIRDDGGGARHVYCWGADSEAQLGNGATGSVAGTMYRIADPIDGEHHDWATVSAGVSVACATRDGGQAYCWGRNVDSQAGTGVAGGNLDTPTRVAASTDGGQQLFSSISAGSVTSCAIGVDGGLYCWGDNSYNLLGRIDVANTPTPRRIGLDADWSAISVYYYLACGSRAGGVWCWGNGDAGGVGDGNWTYDSTPQQVAGISSSAMVSASYREACAAPAGGGVVCWGENNEGELGIGEMAMKHEPTLIQPAGGWDEVAAGAHHTCGIRGGEVRCWGWDVNGQQSGTVSEGPRVPTPVVGVPAALEIAVGDVHSCAIANDGSGYVPWCWGYNSDGQVGIGTPGLRLTPVELEIAGAWSDLVATVAATCAIAGTERRCWGLGAEYAFGNASTSLLPTPTTIADGAAWAAHTLGRQFGCGIQNTQALACWGIDDFGAQGDGGSAMTAMTPHVVDAGTTYDKVAADASAHVCAIQTDGDLACWGRNNYGQTGHPAGLDTDTVTVVTGTGDWGHITTGSAHTCGIKDGDLYCWGHHEYGQLGLDDWSFNARDTPQKIGSANGWDRVSAGDNHTCAILDGDLYCWGTNTHGQLGDGTGSYNTPQAVLLPGS